MLKLKENIQEFINIAELSKKERTKEEDFSKDESERVQSSVSDAIKKITFDYIQNDSDSTENSFLEKEYSKQINDDKQRETILVDEKREYDIPINQTNSKKITVFWKMTKNSEWFIYDEVSAEVFINVNHDFFKPYINDHNFRILIEKLVLSYVIAEEMALKSPSSLSAPKGYVLPSYIRNTMNEILEKLSDRID